MAKENPLVYSTLSGRIKTSDDTSKKSLPINPLKKRDCAYIQWQIQGRRGRGVTLISGIEADEAVLLRLLFDLKSKCACGGTLKAGTIEIQGDQRENVKKILTEKGIKWR